MATVQDISAQEEVDEFLLAAYLSHGLPRELRREIELYLLNNRNARDLLGMANEALQQANLPSPARVPEIQEEEVPAGDPYVQTPADRSYVRTRMLIATLPILVVTAGLLILALRWNPGPSLPAGTSAATMATTWMPSISGDGNTLSWNALPTAASYAVVVYSSETSRIVNLQATTQNRLNDLQSVLYSYRDTDDSDLAVWVIALDTEGTVLRSSARIHPVSNRY